MCSRSGSHNESSNVMRETLKSDQQVEIQHYLPTLRTLFIVGFLLILFYILCLVFVDHFFLLSGDFWGIPSLVLFLLLPMSILLQKFSDHRFPRIRQIPVGFVRLFIWIISCVVILTVFGQALESRWGIVDDHEVISFLGEDRSLSIDEFFSTLVDSTEIGLHQTIVRYRPFYYIARLTETMVWGYNVTSWYAFRIFLFVICVGIVWEILRKPFGFWESGAMVLYCLTFPFWADIFVRLGPSETYTVPGLLMFGWGFGGIVRDGNGEIKTRFWHGLAMSVGAVICIGSKENFFFLILPLLYLVWRNWRNPKQRKLLFVSVGIPLAFATFIYANLIYRFVQTRWRDVYTTSVTPQDRFTALFGFGSSFVFTHLLPLLIMMGFGALFFFWMKKVRKDSAECVSQSRSSVLLLTGFLIVLYALQWFIYNWDWPSGGDRYDFPGILVGPAFILLLYWVALNFFSLQEQLKLYIRVAFVVAMVFATIGKGYKNVSFVVDYNVTQTQIFSQSVDEIVQFLTVHPDYALVLECYRAIDYEAVFSYERYLRLAGVKNDFFIRLDGIDVKQVNTSMLNNLYHTLQEISLNGSGSYKPIRALSAFQDKCYSFHISGYVPTNCSHDGRLYVK